MTAADVQRFWSKVDKSGGPDACWPWLKGKDKDGYGKFQIGPHGHQQHLRAHRVALELTVGTFKGLALHKCDNPPCCNPKCLFAGTQLINRQDAKRKGRVATGDRNGARLYPERMPRGDNHARAILTEMAVRQMFTRQREGAHTMELVQEFHIDRSTVWKVLTGRSWAHLNLASTSKADRK